MKTLLKQTLIAAALGTAIAASAQYSNPPSSPAGTSANPNPPATSSPSYGTDNGASASHDHYWACLFVLGSANQDACIAREKAKAGGGRAMGDSSSSSASSMSSGMGTSGSASGGTGASGGTSSSDTGGAAKQ